MRKVITVTALLALMVAAGAHAQTPSARPPPLDGLPPERWQTSPYHGQIDGNGRRIPCRCRFDGRSYPLGSIVCMPSLGSVLARCDLIDNNSSWLPSRVPCDADGRS